MNHSLNINDPDLIIDDTYLYGLSSVKKFLIIVG